MGIALSGSQGRVTEQLLYCTKIRTALENVGRRTVTQCVRGDARNSGLPGESMNALADRARINTTATGAEECGLATSAGYETASDIQPVSDSARCRKPEGHNSLLVTLARDPYRPPFKIQIAHIYGTEF